MDILNGSVWKLITCWADHNDTEISKTLIHTNHKYTDIGICTRKWSMCDLNILLSRRHPMGGEIYHNPVRIRAQRWHRDTEAPREVNQGIRSRHLVEAGSLLLYPCLWGWCCFIFTAKMNPIVIVAFSMMKLLLQQGAAKPGAAKKDVACPPETGLSKCDMCDKISGSSCLCGRLAVVCNIISLSPPPISVFFCVWNYSLNAFCLLRLYCAHSGKNALSPVPYITWWSFGDYL